MDFFNFWISITPFWAIPVMIISMQMGMTFKKRAKMQSLKAAIIAFIIAFIALSYFVWSGSPSKAVKGLSEYSSVFEN